MKIEVKVDSRLKVKVSFYKDSIAIIELSGELTVFTEEFDLFNKEIMAYIKMGIYKFVVNLNNLTYIDSSGVGVLMRMGSFAAKNKTKLCLICDHPNILKVLAISKVDVFFKHVNNLSEGISFFEQK